MLFSLFKITTFNKVGFDDVFFALNQSLDSKIIIINTLPCTEQNYLIKNTIPFATEEKVINESMQLYQQKIIIIYGKNTLDSTIETKYNQLLQLGYLRCNLFIYYGGIFEWALLQDTYGDTNFPTTSQIIDYLVFKPESSFKDQFIN